MSINDPDEVREMQTAQAEELLTEAKQDLPLGEYEHYKGEHVYVFALSLHEETLDVLVHYFAHKKGIWWTRTLENFKENVDAGGGNVPRFRFIRFAMNSDILFATGMI